MAVSPKTRVVLLRRGNGKYGWWMIEAGAGAAPRCYLSPSGWCATPPLLLSYLWPAITQLEKTRYGQILLSQRQDATAG